MTYKNRKNLEILSFEVLDVVFWMLRAISYSLDILHGGLRINKLQLKKKKKFNYFSAVHFASSNLIIKTLDPEPDPHWPKTLDPELHWNTVINVIRD